MTVGTHESLEMGKNSINDEKTQADFIKEELNFNIDPKDPITKASLNDHPINEWIDILGNGQLKKKIVVPGIEGTRPNRGDMCTLSLLGRLNGTQVTIENHETIVIQLGDVEVVQGLDLAIALMNLNEVAEIEIHHRFAFGLLGLPPIVPPNATVHYVVELLAFEIETDIETLSIKEKKKIGNKKRERGNWWFSRNEVTFAMQCYRRALDFLTPGKSGKNMSQKEMEEMVGDDELQDLLEDRAKVYNNLAASQMKMEAYDAALESLEHVLAFQPRNLKALYRKGKVLHSKGEHLQAQEILLKALKIEPHFKPLEIELSILKEKIAKDALHEKNLYRKMLGTNMTANNSLGNQGQDKGKFNKTMWGLIGGASAAALVGVLAYRFTT